MKTQLRTSVAITKKTLDEKYYLHIEYQATGKTRSCNVKDVVHEPPIEFWNTDTQFGRAGKFINHPMNLPTIKLND